MKWKQGCYLTWRILLAHCNKVLQYNTYYKTFKKCKRRLSGQTCVLLLRSCCALGLCPNSLLSSVHFCHGCGFRQWWEPLETGIKDMLHKIHSSCTFNSHWHYHVLFILSYQCGSSATQHVLKRSNSPTVSLSFNSWAMKEDVYVLYYCIGTSTPVFSSQAKQRLKICSSAF